MTKEKISEDNVENKTRQISVNAQFVKDISFENPKAPASLIAKGKPKIDVSVDVKAGKIGDNTYEVILGISANAKKDDEISFISEISYVGIFTLIGISDEELEPTLLIYCPSLLFPFARRIIADTTRDGGFPPLLLDPMDFASLYTSRKAAEMSDDKNTQTSAEVD